MKHTVLTLITLAAFSLNAGAQPKKSDAKAAEKAPAEKVVEKDKDKDKEAAPAALADESKSMPFYGEIREVNAKAKSFTVGTRTFLVTPATEMKMADKVAKASDVAVGLMAGGSFVENGNKMEVKKLTLKTKEEAAADRAAKKEAEAGKALDKAADKTAEAKDDVKEAANEVKDKAKDATTTSKKAVGKAADATTDTLKEATDKAADAKESVKDAVKEGAGTAKKTAGKTAEAAEEAVTPKKNK